MRIRDILAESALLDLEFLPTPLVRQVESEVVALFSDGPPANALTIRGGTSFVELPCGVEVFFREFDSEVKIFAISDPRV